MGAVASPGFQLGLDIAAIKEKNPQAIGCILGGHGITAWGDTSRRGREELAAGSSTPPQPYIDENGQEGPVRSTAREVRRPRREDERRAKAAALAPTIRGLASHDKPMVGHFTDDRARARVPRQRERTALAELGTSCPDHFLRTKVKPMLLDLPRPPPSIEARSRG